MALCLALAGPQAHRRVRSSIPHFLELTLPVQSAGGWLHLPGAGMAFLVAGGITSFPAAMAVWALARPSVFILYIFMSLSGAFLSGVIFQLWIVA